MKKFGSPKYNKMKITILILLVLLPSSIPIKTVLSNGQKTSIGDLLSTGKAISISGASGDGWVGGQTAYSSPGDLNGDQIDDLVVNSKNTVYLFFGKGGYWSNLSTSNADVAITTDIVGGFQNVIGPGDINNDSINDLIISEMGCFKSNCRPVRTHIFFGRSDWNSSLVVTDSNVFFSAEHDDEYLGHGMDAIGDINGDGIVDFVISAEANYQVAPSSGKVYIIFGRNTYEWTKCNGLVIDKVANATFLGTATNSLLGANIASIGDTDNDGYADFLIQGVQEFMYSGQIVKARVNYLIFGKNFHSWGYNVSIANVADVIFSFPSEMQTYSLLGKMMANANDVNNDGFSDFIMGGYLAGNENSGEGKSYIVLGRSENGWPSKGSTVNASDFTGAIFNGQFANEYLGFSVSGLKDFNKDGYADVVFSATKNDGSKPGIVYIVYGNSNEDWNNSLNPENANLVINSSISTINPWFAQDVSDAGDINNDGFTDLIISAPFANNRVGEAFIVFGSNRWDSGSSSSTNAPGSSTSNSTNASGFNLLIFCITFLILIKRSKKIRT